MSALLRLALGASLAALLGVAPPRPVEPAPSGVEVPPSTFTVVGSCVVSKSTCVDFAGAWTTGEPKSRCARLKGRWDDSPCPVEGRLGTCTQRETGSDDRTQTRTYSPGTAQAAKAACKKVPRGAWLAF